MSPIAARRPPGGLQPGDGLRDLPGSSPSRMPEAVLRLRLARHSLARHSDDSSRSAGGASPTAAPPRPAAPERLADSCPAPPDRPSSAARAAPPRRSWAPSLPPLPGSAIDLTGSEGQTARGA